MQQIGLAKPQHAPFIADFQLRMAMETQNLKLDAELVGRAVEYFISLGLDHKFSHLGFYLVKKVEEEIVGSLLITFETATRWWIQSVYVKQTHRRQGHFTSLFQKAVELAKENAVESIKLYAESENQRAKATYFKLGMHVIKGKFYSYDFVFGNPLLWPKANFEFSKNSQRKAEIKQWKLSKNNALGIEQQDSHEDFIVIEQDKKMVGVFKYFQQFSDWRFGIMRYVQEIYLAENIPLEDVMPGVISYLTETSKIKVAAVRFIASDEVAHQLKGGHLDHYDILAIYLK